MSLIGEANKISVVKIVQELLLAEDAQSIPHSLISEKINLVLALNPRWTEDLDRESVINELIRRHSEWVGTQGGIALC